MFHQAPPELEQKIIADATDDLKTVASITSDPGPLAKVMTGKALEETKASITNDVAQGKTKKRDYQNINIRLEDYTPPIAQIFAEFDDNSYYTDAKTGEAIDQPTKEHKSYALALIEEDNRWKIRLIMSSAAGSTKTGDQ